MDLGEAACTTSEVGVSVGVARARPLLFFDFEVLEGILRVDLREMACATSRAGGLGCGLNLRALPLFAFEGLRRVVWVHFSCWLLGVLGGGCGD